MPVLGFFYACDEILEENISNDSIITVSPKNNDLIISNTVGFHWMELEDADEYQIQINNSQNIIMVDSTVSTNYFNYPLIAGNYDWRVRGKNFAYQTSYTFPISFSVESTFDLSNETVILNSPSPNTYFNYSENITFTWTAMPNSDSYTFELEKKPDNIVLFNQTGITETLYLLDNNVIQEDAEFLWKIKALNDSTSTETLYSTRTFFIDRVLPNTPILTSPEDEIFILTNESIVFVWENGNDTGNIKSPIHSILQIANDIGFNTIVEEFSISENNQSHFFTETGEYYWRVKNLDAAGNSSSYSMTRKITVE